MPRTPTGFSRVAIGYKDPETAITAIDGAYPLNIAFAAGEPASSVSAGNPGDIAVSATHLYVCISADSWSRTTLTGF